MHATSGHWIQSHRGHTHTSIYGPIQFTMALNNLSNSANSSSGTTTNNSASNHLNDESLNSPAISASNVAAATAALAAANEHLVRVDENSAVNLQALFDVALNQEARPLQIPFRLRNLPDSFFNPPSTGSKSPSISHTRENSNDSAFGSAAPTICSSSVSQRLRKHFFFCSCDDPNRSVAV